MTKAYPSNLTWEQWELIADLFPEAKTGGRPRSLALIAVVNAILYVLCQGCTWRAMRWRFSCLVNCLWLFLEVASGWYLVENSRSTCAFGLGLPQGDRLAHQKLSLIANQ